MTTKQITYLRWLNKAGKADYWDESGTLFGEGLLDSIRHIQVDRLEAKGYIRWSTTHQHNFITQAGKEVLKQMSESCISES